MNKLRDIIYKDDKPYIITKLVNDKIDEIMSLKEYILKTNVVKYNEEYMTIYDLLCSLGIDLENV